MAKAGMIKVTPELLRSKAQNVETYKTNYDDNMKKLTTLVKGLNEIWLGDAQMAFMEEFENMQPTFNKFSVLLATYAKEMKNSANELEAADREAAAKTRSDLGSL